MLNLTPCSYRYPYSFAVSGMTYAQNANPRQLLSNARHNKANPISKYFAPPTGSLTVAHSSNTSLASGGNSFAESKCDTHTIKLFGSSLSRSHSQCVFLGLLAKLLWILFYRTYFGFQFACFLLFFFVCFVYVFYENLFLRLNCCRLRILHSECESVCVSI